MIGLGIGLSASHRVASGGAPPPPPLDNTKSIQFDGIDAHTQATIIGGGYRTAVIRTFSMWVKTTNTQVPLFCGSGNYPNPPLFRNCNGFGIHAGRLKWCLDGWVLTSQYTYAHSELVDGSGSAPNISDGNWHHVAIYNPVDSNANSANIANTKMWLDGQPLTMSTTFAGSYDIRGFNGSLILGAGSIGGSSGQYYANAQMDEFAYWDNLELSDSQVLTLYNSGVPTNLNLFSVVPNEWYRLGDLAVYNTNSQWWDIPNSIGKDFFSSRSQRFDGVDGVVNCGTSSALEIDGDMTISLWVYPFYPNSAYPSLVGKRDAGGANYELYFSNAGSPWSGNSRFLVFSSGVSGMTSTTSVKFEEWSHVAVVINSGVTNGSTIYLNGVAVATGTVTITADDAPLLFGKHETWTFWYNGNMDDIAIYDSAVEIGELWDGSGRPTDLSTYSTHSFYFDGIDEYIILGDSDTFSFGNGSTDSAFSISSWIYYNGDAGWKGIVSKWDASATKKEYLFYLSANKLRILLGDSSSGGTIGYEASGTFTLSTWVHVVATYSGSSAVGGLTLYVDGSAIAVSDISSGSYTAMENSDQPLWIGNGEDGAGTLHPFGGNIDSVSVWSVELSASQILGYYSDGKPTNLTAESNLVAYYRMGEDALYNGATTQFNVPDNSVNSNEGTTVNMDFADLQENAPLSPVGYWRMGEQSDVYWNNTDWQIPDYTKKALFSQQSMEFDGINSRINMVVNLGTISSESVWIKQATPTSAEVVIGIPIATVVPNNSYHLYFHTAGQCYVRVGDYYWLFDSVATKTAINTTDWIHLAIIRTGVTTCILYVNGVDNDGVQTEASLSGDTQISNLGCQDNDLYDFQGLIDDYACWKDTALTQTQVNTIFNSGKPSDLTTYSTKSFYFDGIDDNINCGAVSEIEGLSQVTLSAWIKRDAGAGGAGGWDMVCFKNPILGFFQWGTANQMNFKTTTVGNGAKDVQSNTGIFDGQWHHICGVYDGITQKLFVDGVLANSIANVGGVISTSVKDFYIGIQDGNLIPWVGGIDEISIYNEVKSASTLYNLGVPSDLSGESGLISWWRMGENAIYNGATTEFNVPDNSVNSNAGTSANMDLANLVESAPFSPLAYYRLGESSTFNDDSNWEIPNYQKINNFSSHSFQFDGIDDDVTCAGANLVGGATKMSVSCWWYRDPLMSGVDSILGHYNASPFRIWFRDVQGFAFEVSEVGGWVSWEGGVFQSHSGITTGNWYHIACTWDASTNEIKGYINGVEGSASPLTTTISSLYNGASWRDLIMMGNLGYGGYGLGKLDDVAIFSNRVLSESDVMTIFNSGTPTDLTAELKLVGYWRMGTGATWSSPRWNIPDLSENSNNGVGNGMDESARVNTAPSNTNQGLSDAMIQVDKKLISPTNANRGEGSGMDIDDNTNSAPNNFGTKTANIETDPFTNDVPT